MESTYKHKAADGYDHKRVEATVQSHWSSTNAYLAVENDPRFPKGKYYACSMLPYPSGKLHMGHVRNYTINDMLVRYLRMQGYNVLMPMGWDAFGLPAENAAMKAKVAPAAWTYENIRTMKSQCNALGLAIDWSRELATCDPQYYKWNQWFFLKCLENGLAYRKTQIVNWDPVDQTVLANEQVIDGRGWRSGALVEKREIPGYYMNITKYADELLDATLHKLPGWSDRLRTIQENWIGKSEGVRFAFPHDIKDASGTPILDGKMYVFTTRADTIMGVTFVAVAPEHPLAVRAGEVNPALAPKIHALKLGGTTEAELAVKEKEGVATGLFVTHPLTGEQVEIWVGNYVLITYGDGAVMGVPGHDERDFAFAKKYGLAIKPVYRRMGPIGDRVRGEKPRANESMEEIDTSVWKDWYTATDDLMWTYNSFQYNDMKHRDAVNAVAKDLAEDGLGEKKTTFRLRDWGISRQRYWGTPIPVIHCDDCGVVPVPEKDLPVVLPEHHIPDGSGSPLKHDEAFLNCSCPKCGKPARRETDTMDTFVDSAWYYMRYASPDATMDGRPAMVDARNDYWMPMDQYIGGIEHAVLHLLYARFWTKAMRDMGLLRFDEPFKRMTNHGMLLNHIFFKPTEHGTKDYIPPTDVHNTFDEKGHINGGTLADGSTVQYGGIGKMGKSERNGVDPQDLIDKYGADTARLYVMFVGGPEDPAVWSDNAVEGALRFLRRVWTYCADRADDIKSAPASFDVGTLDAKLKATRFDLHSALKQSNFDYERQQYNTVVSAAMKMLNALETVKPGQCPSLAREGASILLRSLYPVAPHITCTLWADLGLEKAHGTLLDAAWPQPDPQALVQSEIKLVLQVNGKTRGEIVVDASADKATIEAAAAASPDVAKFGEGRTPKKIIVVPGRLVNVVV